MPRKKKTETEIESKEIESKEIEMESKPKGIESTPLEDNRTLAQKLANYKRKLRRL